MKRSCLTRQYNRSQRSSCRLIGLNLSSVRYVRFTKDDSSLIAAIIEISRRYNRYGYRRIHAVLKRKKWALNVKRVRRIYCNLVLQVKRRIKKRVASTLRHPLIKPNLPNQVWSMDFVHDSLTDKRNFRCLNIVDDYCKRALAIEVDTSLPALRVIRILTQLAQTQGLPKAIRVDHGPEFISQQFNHWAQDNRIQLLYTQPGKPTQNAFIESFNGKFSDECLNEHCFSSLQQARQIIENWRIDYNEFRPHSALAQLSPNQYARENGFLTTKSTL